MDMIPWCANGFMNMDWWITMTDGVHWSGGQIEGIMLFIGIMVQYIRPMASDATMWCPSYPLQQAQLSR